MNRGKDDKEKREFVRIDDSIPLEYKIIKKRDNLSGDEEKIQESDELASSVDWLSDIITQENVIDTSKDITSILANINQKLDFILTYIINREEKGFKLPKKRRVNISGSGIRFESEQELRIGDLIEFMLILPVIPPMNIIITGKVIRVNEIIKDGKMRYETAIKFIKIKERDREKIIQYTFKRQMDMLRSQKR